ncbi:unnamed protein product [Rotaria sp. Silwood2]|nr:unnamed protein product [Rotaria sp. Silwood2]CAF3236949.1 unnamed protein product [Rotaria sp. Silwood2]CAF3321663.1 unnamed protein product [Rotaria sp. Silwood2]CAF3472757.1 unnamed protein product [Rotaria sp. Silwood2]CAF4120264.1 unnamed protein product [Rotaria sp. Silwood2]
MTNYEITEVENQIKSILRHQSSNNSTQSSTTLSSNITSNTNAISTIEKKKKKSLISFFVSAINGEDIQETKKQQTTMKILNEEFKLYKKLAAQFVLTANDVYDTLIFWKQNKVLFPNLMTLAQKYLSVPGTSVKAESAFSISSYIGRKQRARLSADNLCFSVFLKDKL